MVPHPRISVFLMPDIDCRASRPLSLPQHREWTTGNGQRLSLSFGQIFVGQICESDNVQVRLVKQPLIIREFRN
eukprot:2127038-Prymnesium_polylepis.1